MLGSDIQPDVVSCTALISALAADGQYQHAERALDWMLQVQPQPISYHAHCSLHEPNICFCEFYPFAVLARRKRGSRASKLCNDMAAVL